MSAACRWCGHRSFGGDGHECDGVKLSREHAELRALVHRIAVARRGDCDDVDDRWEDLPAEIEGMWAQINDLPTYWESKA